MAKAKRHTREYKLQAVQMVVREKRKIVDVASELGIHEVLLGRWKREFEKDPEVFNRATRLHPMEIENRRLKRENDLLREEASVLKKAITYFKEHDR
jgi:transposase